MTEQQPDEPERSVEEAPLDPPPEPPSPRVVDPRLWAFTTLLAVVGGAAIVAALGLALLVAALHASDADLNQALSRLSAAARGLPGVRAADPRAGLGDLGTTPVDIYGDVHLDDTCTAAALRTTATRLRTIMAREQVFHWHPTLWCDDRGLTVSSSAPVTERRLAIVGRLARDRSLRAAAVIVTQHADDPSPDLDDAALQVDLYVNARTGGEAARTWLDRLAPSLPRVTVTATTGHPGDYLDPLALADGQWTVDARAGHPSTPAILRTAARIDESPDVTGAYTDGPGQQIVIHAASTRVLHELEATLSAPRDRDESLRVTVTLTPIAAIARDPDART